MTIMEDYFSFFLFLIITILVPYHTPNKIITFFYISKQDYNFENRSLKDAYKQAIEYTVLQNKFITLTPAHQSTRHISSNHSNSATTLLILLYIFFDSGRTRMKKTA